MNVYEVTVSNMRLNIKGHPYIDSHHHLFDTEETAKKYMDKARALAKHLAAETDFCLEKKEVFVAVEDLIKYIDLD